MSTIRQLAHRADAYGMPFMMSLILVLATAGITDSWLGVRLNTIALIFLWLLIFLVSLWVQEVCLPKLRAKSAGQDKRDEVASAEQRLESLLNYGGIHLDDTQVPPRLTLQYQDGDVVDEVAQMRRIGHAFLELADRVEAQAKRAPDTKVPHTSR